MVTKTDREYTYTTIVNALKQAIEDRQYKENERLPSEFELLQEYNVSRTILREALAYLEAEKWVTHDHGVGIFVNPRPLFDAGIEELSSVTQMIVDGGMEPGTIFVDVATTDTTDDNMIRFDHEEDDHLVTIKRVRTANDEPVVYCIDQLLVRHFPVGADDVWTISLFDAIERSGDVRIDHAVTSIEPVAYDHDASEALRCGVDVPLLVLSQSHYSDDGEMVLFSKNYFRADKFNFHVIRKRKN